MKQYLQVSLDVEGRLCLVVGGGAEAAEKTERLLDAGAQVSLVSPRIDATLTAWEAEGRITVRHRGFQAEDTDGVFLVQNCVQSDPALSAQIYQLAQEKRFLVGAWDQPQYSTYTMPALVRRGRLRLAVSTGAASPALAALLRIQFERLFDDTFVAFLEWLATRRQERARSVADRAERSQLSREDLRGFRIKGQITYPESFQQEQGER
ncbi:MAG TPA: bifunctional precorrin-2 dehydrogenase/sirohydrochlorin ferrochelatase [Armatimonadota bacterium]|nr:bifunctional precorrin-2 dehydrogenase/sirohydrochlorin ferrochelatase [Armatimonadota bacterium]